MRFRLKTDYLQFVRDQIRGGLWFAPSWWTAVSRVPPDHFTPPVGKRAVPRVTFPEDRLARAFRARNPALAAFDVPRAGAPPGSTVAAAFAARQAAAMAAGAAREPAYDAALAWLLENGRELAARLDVPPPVRAALALEPRGVPAARAAAEAAMAAELARVRAALADDRAAAAREAAAAAEGAAASLAAAGAEPLGRALGPAARAALARRAASDEPAYEGGASAAEAAAEADVRAAAAAAAAPRATDETSELAMIALVTGKAAAPAGGDAKGGAAERR